MSAFAGTMVGEVLPSNYSPGPIWREIARVRAARGDKAGAAQARQQSKGAGIAGKVASHYRGGRRAAA